VQNVSARARQLACARKQQLHNVSNIRRGAVDVFGTLLYAVGYLGAVITVASKPWYTAAALAHVLPLRTQKVRVLRTYGT
jgi:hypothetical protein